MSTRHRLRPLTLLVLYAVLCCFAPLRAMAAEEGIIRDEEIERTLKSWIRPVIIADNLDPAAVHIVIVQSPDINAFVAGGPNIFLYTGLMLKADSAQEIVAVLSHELGHIAGGHLIRGHDEMKNASFESLLGSIVGIGAAILAGNGGAGVAAAAGASSMAQRNYLAFSRVQESSADQAALSGMRKAHYNPSGMISFLQKMQGEELLPESQQDKYIQTHPLTQERIEAVQHGVETSPYKNQPEPAAWKDQFARIKAKLTGFINPGQVAWTYADKDHSIPAQYARAIAAYRQNHVQEALAGIDRLLAAEPDNPYFLELKGQMLVDFGKVGEAVPYYRKAVDLLPGAGLIRIAYGGAILNSFEDNDPQRLQQAADQLERAVRDEPRSILAQRLLATAYGRMGREPAAKLHLAEEAALKGDTRFAKAQVAAALRGLKPGTSEWLQARDLKDVLDQTPDKPEQPPRGRFP
jgi:predicted Zn-dependent protease